MTQKGIIKHIGNLEQITEKLSKLVFVINRPEQKYNQDLALELVNGKTSLLDGVGVGVEVEVSIDVSSREFKGKWYTQATAWDVKVLSSASSSGPSPSAEDDDLPF